MTMVKKGLPVSFLSVFVLTHIFFPFTNQPYVQRTGDVTTVMAVVWEKGHSATQVYKRE